MADLVPNGTQVPRVVRARRLRTELGFPIWEEEGKVSTAVQGQPRMQQRSPTVKVRRVCARRRVHHLYDYVDEAGVGEDVLQEIHCVRILPQVQGEFADAGGDLLADP